MSANEDSGTVLVVDDDARLRELLNEYLSSRGFTVREAIDGTAALASVNESAPDLVVLDIMMPGIDGLETLRRLRQFSQVPVIMLTARGEDTDRIVGLELGADDYLPKPFNPRELLARAQAVLRRSTAASDPVSERIVLGPLEIDPDRREVFLEGEALEFTTTEFEILRTLASQAGRVIPRERLMELARGEEFSAFDRSVDVHVSHIRKKLGDPPKKPRFIKTVRGVGYTVPRSP